MIGVDPGGTTGVAEYTIEDASTPAVPRAFNQLGEPDSVPNFMRERAAYWRALGFNPVFVIEQFDKRPGVADPDFTPMFIIRDIEKHLSGSTGLYQTPSQAKNLVKPAHRGAPDGLKRFGWYQAGMGHANDASRHVIVFLVEKLHHLPTIERGWPKRG